MFYRAMSSIVFVSGFMSFFVSETIAADSATYANDVQPIIADRCVSCHGPEKQKGELRLDSPEAILKGGKNGLILYAGKPEKSTLYTLTILAKGDDDVMPAKGDPLTQNQTDRIRDWIKNGAQFDGVNLQAPQLQAALGPVTLPPSDVDQLASKLQTPDANVIKSLTEQGAIIVPISADKKALDVNVSHLTRPFDTSHIALLERIAPNIFWLDLSHSAVSDGSSEFIAKCKNLLRLNLDKTKISSTTLAVLKNCQKLTYLNLIETEVDDKGLAQLQSIKDLEKVYVMNSKVTQTGIDAMQKMMPQTRYIGNPTNMPKPPPRTEGNPNDRRRKK